MHRISSWVMTSLTCVMPLSSRLRVAGRAGRALPPQAMDARSLSRFSSSLLVRHASHHLRSTHSSLLNRAFLRSLPTARRRSRCAPSPSWISLPLPHSFPATPSLFPPGASFASSARNPKKAKGGKVTYLCTECGEDTSQWYGQCPSCKEFGTLKEFREPTLAAAGKGPVTSRVRSAASASAANRQSTRRASPLHPRRRRSDLAPPSRPHPSRGPPWRLL